jgi:hypothetical protein
MVHWIKESIYFVYTELEPGCPNVSSFYMCPWLEKKIIFFIKNPRKFQFTTVETLTKWLPFWVHVTQSRNMIGWEIRVRDWIRFCDCVTCCFKMPAMLFQNGAKWQPFCFKFHEYFHRHIWLFRRVDYRRTSFLCRFLIYGKFYLLTGHVYVQQISWPTTCKCSNYFAKIFFVDPYNKQNFYSAKLPIQTSKQNLSYENLSYEKLLCCNQLNAFTPNPLRKLKVNLYDCHSGIWKQLLTPLFLFISLWWDLKCDTFRSYVPEWHYNRIRLVVSCRWPLKGHIHIQDAVQNVKLTFCVGRWVISVKARSHYTTITIR